MSTQKNQSNPADLAERSLSLAAGAAFVIDAVQRRSWISLITAPLGAVLLAHGSTRTPLLDRLLPARVADSAEANVAKSGTTQQPIENLAVTQAVTVDRLGGGVVQLLAQF